MTTENQIITLRSGNTEIEIWTIGARLNAVSWAGFSGLLEGANTVAEALGPLVNNGCTVAPVANRIAKSTFEIDGATYRLEPNEGGETVCHSGDRSLRDKVWSVEHLDDKSVTLAANVADMADWFPGNRVFRTKFTVLDDGFDLTFSAETDAPTLANMALHPFWSLNGTGRTGQSMQIAADAYLPIDELKIPTGEIASVEATMFDLRDARVPSIEIDHNYCLSTSGLDERAVQMVADNGLTLDIYTDAPGLQVYTGKDTGIAVEPQHWPDAPHHDNFPSIRLDPGQTYTQNTRYRFSKG